MLSEHPPDSGIIIKDHARMVSAFTAFFMLQ